MNLETPLAIAKRCVVQAGHGRGFVVSSGEDRYVITAAHCLPRLPTEISLDKDLTEHTYSNILGPLGLARRDVWAELVLLSTVDDIAVFHAPDSQEFFDRQDGYEELTAHAMTLGQSPKASVLLQEGAEYYVSAWVLSLDRAWQHCLVRNNGRLLSITPGEESLIKSGMSGSPIINDFGAVIGVVSMGGSRGMNWHSSLSDCLPSWLLRILD